MIILGLIFFIPFYFAWQYNDPEKNSTIQEVTVRPISKKTKSKMRQINEEEYNQLFHDRFQKQPLIFNESNHALETIPLIHQEQNNEALEHEELLEHLQIHKKRTPQLFYLQPRTAKPQVKHSLLHEHNAQHQMGAHYKNALEQIRYIQNIMHEKMKAAMNWQRQAAEQFQKFVQHHHAHHMQRTLHQQGETFEPKPIEQS